MKRRILLILVLLGLTGRTLSMTENVARALPAVASLGAVALLSNDMQQFIAHLPMVVGLSLMPFLLARNDCADDDKSKALAFLLAAGLGAFANLCSQSAGDRNIWRYVVCACTAAGAFSGAQRFIKDLTNPVS